MIRTSLAILLAAAGTSLAQTAAPASAQPKTPVLTPIDKPPFDQKQLTAADKVKQARQAAQKRHDELKDRWAKGYPVEGKPPIALQFDEPVRNLGRVNDDAKIDIAFKFKNISGQSVKIKQAKPGCGCTVANLAKDTYAPGEEGVIQATYDPNHRSGLEFKDIDVSVDEAGAPNIKIGFLVDTLPRVVTEPKSAVVGEVRKGQTGKAIIAVVGREPGFDVTSAVLADPKAPFTVTKVGRAEETDAAGDKVTRVTFEATLNPGNPVGVYSTAMNFATNDPKRATISAPVQAIVVGDLKAAPDRVFVVSGSGTPFSREVILSHRTNKPFNVLGVQTEALSPGFAPVLDLKARDATGKPGEITAYTLTVSGVMPAPAPGTNTGSSGKIVILTDSPDQPRIEIPIQGVIASAIPSVPAPAKK